MRKVKVVNNTDRLQRLMELRGQMALIPGSVFHEERQSSGEIDCRSLRSENK